MTHLLECRSHSSLSRSTSSSGWCFDVSFTLNKGHRQFGQNLVRVKAHCQNSESTPGCARGKDSVSGAIADKFY